MDLRRPVGLILLLAIVLVAEPASGLEAVHDGSTDHWTQLLADHVLSRESSHGPRPTSGYRSRETWHLCRDGRFQFTHIQSLSQDTPGNLSSSTNRSVQSGRWLVTVDDGDVVLVLRFAGGGETSYRLRDLGDEVTLDGTPVKRTPSKQCR